MIDEIKITVVLILVTVIFVAIVTDFKAREVNRVSENQLTYLDASLLALIVEAK